MRNAGLDEAQAGIKTAGRNINNLRYAEKEMATHSSVLAWRIPGTGGAWWAAIFGVAQGQTRLK